MSTTSVQNHNTTLPTEQRLTEQRETRTPTRLRSRYYKQAILISCTLLIIFSTMVVSYNRPTVLAADPGSGNVCSWYTVHAGDTLSAIAWNGHTNIWTLAHTNHIANVNLIFIGQRLCIPHRAGGGGGSNQGSGGWQSGVLPNGYVLWYAYGALQGSTRAEVTAMLRQVAARYGLPANLLLAIAWQESGWTQHVIARDGGIGVMQLMPYTAMSINAGTSVRRDPYHLWDNLNLGATYLYWLWQNFHGNLVKVISAYNEGGWAVIHRGIFNWGYVNSVLYLMRVFR